MRIIHRGETHIGKRNVSKLLLEVLGEGSSCLWCKFRGNINNG